MHQTQKNRTSDIRIFGSLLTLIWSEAGRYFQLRLIAAIFLILATATFSAVTPLFFKQLVDQFSDLNSHPAVVFPILLIAGYIGCQWSARISAELRWAVYGGLEQRIQRRLAIRIFDHIHCLSLRFHLARRTGALQQIVGNGLLGYCLIFHNLMFVIIPLMLELLLVSSILVNFYQWPFLLTFLVTAVLYISSSIAGIKHQQISQRAANTANVDAFARATESYINFETIKYFGIEHKIREEFDGALLRAESGWSRFYWARSAIGLIQSLWLTIGLAATVTLAASGVMAGTMTMGDFVLVNAYILQLMRPLENLGFAYREIKTGITYVENLLELFSERAEVTNASHAKPLRPGPGEIVFRDVSFSFGNGNLVLNKASFKISAGHRVAIVGSTGAGKSTLSKLIFRFYDVSDGQIEIDGQDVRKVTLESLRASIAVIPQDIVLFNDTIAYNIGIGRPDCVQEQIEQAATLAEMHSFIVSLPDGYETLVGERGLKLSGGERQRVAIARALLKQSRIYIFDEATSALDNETERRIQHNLKNALAGVTIIIIGHRRTTIDDVDEVLMVSSGSVTKCNLNDNFLGVS